MEDSEDCLFHACEVVLVVLCGLFYLWFVIARMLVCIIDDYVVKWIFALDASPSLLFVSSRRSRSSMFWVGQGKACC